MATAASGTSGVSVLASLFAHQTAQKALDAHHHRCSLHHHVRLEVAAFLSWQQPSQASLAQQFWLHPWVWLDQKSERCARVVTGVLHSVDLELEQEVQSVQWGAALVQRAGLVVGASMVYPCLHLSPSLASAS